MDVRQPCWVTSPRYPLAPPTGSVPWMTWLVPSDFPLTGVWPFDVFQTDWRSARSFGQLDRVLAEMCPQADVVVAAVGPADAVAAVFWANGRLRKREGKLLWWVPDGVGWRHPAMELTKACRLARAASADIAAESLATAETLLRYVPGVTVRILGRQDADGWEQWLAEPPPETHYRDRVSQAVHDLMAYPLRVDWTSVPENRRHLCYLLADAICRMLQAGYSRCVLYGAGRHTRRLAELIAEMAVDGSIEFAGVVDDDPQKRGGRVGRWPVMGIEDVAALGPVAVLVSSDAHEANMWQRRGQFERLGLPVFCLYQRAASRPEDLQLAQPRRAGAAGCAS